MVEDCQKEIEDFKCGRVEGSGASGSRGARGGGGAAAEDEEEPAPPRYVHSQGATIECLSQRAGELGEPCHKQILRCVRVCRSSVEGTNRRGRPLGRWEDRVKEYVSERGVRGNGLEWARREPMDRERWRSVCRLGRFRRERGVRPID